MIRCVSRSPLRSPLRRLSPSPLRSPLRRLSLSPLRSPLRSLVVLVSIASIALTGCNWLTYHFDLSRSGDDPTEPSLAGVVPAWNAALDGAVYGTPLVIGNKVIVATENDTVYGLDASSGARVWSAHLGTPVPLSALPCGDINPLGVTGTPAIDSGTKTVWAVAEETGPRHVLVGLDVDTGQVLHSYVADPPGQDPTVQQQRGALAVANGVVYVTLGGLAGDCGDYHGWVVAIAESSGAMSTFEVAPDGRQGGIWAPSGPAVGESGSVYVATGNSSATSSGDSYDYSDGVIKLAPPLSSQLQVSDYFAPASWYSDNAVDADLGSVGPSLLSGGLVFQVGKSGRAYLLRDSGLGHIGGQAYVNDLCSAFGGNAYDSTTDVVYVPCTSGLTAVQVTGGSSPSFHVLWQAAQADGPPILVGGLVWSVNLPSGRLYGFNPANGAVRADLALGASSSTVHFVSLSAGGGRLFVGAGSTVAAFARS